MLYSLLCELVTRHTHRRTDRYSNNDTMPDRVTDRSEMNDRYDISPDRYPSTKWLVIDTQCGNMPLSTHDTRQEALRACLSVERKRSTRVK